MDEIEEMRLYLQETLGIPIAVRRLGEYEIDGCPYCGGCHLYDLEPGHVEAQCDDRGIEIFIGGRGFIPNYGFTIYHYEERDGEYMLIDHKA